MRGRMRFSRGGAGAAALDSDIVVLGGYDTRAQSASVSADLFDSEMVSWEGLPSMREKRWGHAVAAGKLRGQ